MSTFNPQPVFAVQVSGSGSELTYRISFFMPSSAGVRTQGRTAFLKTKMDATVEVSAVAVPAQKLVNIVAGVPGEDQGLSVELGTVRFERGEVSDDELELLESAIGHASFLAFSSVSVSSVPAVALEAPVLVAASTRRDGHDGGQPEARSTAVGEPGSRLQGIMAKLRIRRWPVAVCSLAVIAGVAFIGYGILHKPAESFEAAQGGDYSDLQEKIRKQIELAAKTGSPAIDSLQGQNVAIETMKAMGLDPGKANAGCLVGVR